MKYILRKNKLVAKGKDAFMAVPYKNRTYSREDIIEELCERYNFRITKVLIRAILEAFFKLIASKIEKGDHYKDSFFGIKTSIKGAFFTETERYNSNRHNIGICLSAGKDIKNAIHKITPRKTKAESLAPQISSIYNYGNKREPSLHKEDMIELCGFGLKLNAADKLQGIFLRCSENKTIRVSDYRLIQRNLIHFYLPKDLPQGKFSVWIQAQGHRSSIIRKSNKLEVSLTHTMSATNPALLD